MPCTVLSCRPTRIVARSGDLPAAVEVDSGKGHVLVLASPFGVGENTVIAGRIDNAVDRHLATPYPLLNHVRLLLDEVFRREMLFDAGPGSELGRVPQGTGAIHPGSEQQSSTGARPLKIVSHCGEIESMRELALDQSEKGAAGYLPEGFADAAIGKSDPEQIAGGDVRIFSVRVRNENVTEIVHRLPPRHPRGRILSLRNVQLIQERSSRDRRSSSTLTALWWTGPICAQETCCRRRLAGSGEKG